MSCRPDQRGPLIRMIGAGVAEVPAAAVAVAEGAGWADRTAAEAEVGLVVWVQVRIPNPNAIEAAMMSATARIVIDEIVRWKLHVVTEFSRIAALCLWSLFLSSPSLWRRVITIREVARGLVCQRRKCISQSKGLFP